MVATLAGAGLVVWAWLVRRSQVDAVLLFLGGVLLMFVGLRWTIAPELSERLGLMPELLAMVLGVVVFARSFYTGLERTHRQGLRWVGCLLMLPLLPLVLLIALFSLGSGHDYERNAVAAPDNAVGNRAR